MPLSSRSTRNPKAVDDGVRELAAGGVAVFRGVLPVDRVHRVRDDVASVYRAHGWLGTGTDPGELVPDGLRRDGVPGWWRFAEDLQRIERFHALAHEAVLKRIAAGVAGRRVLHHSRRHLTVVNPSFWVPPHQEFLHIQGTAEFFTSHVPLTDGGGTLQVLVEDGPRSVRPLTVLDTKGVAAVVDEATATWRDLPIEPGDVVVMHSLVTRRIRPNRSRGIQLAAQYRFQSSSLPVVKASIKPEHYPRLPDWPRLTRGWSSTRWVRPPLLPNLVEFRMTESMESWHEIAPDTISPTKSP